MYSLKCTPVAVVTLPVALPSTSVSCSMSLMFLFPIDGPSMLMQEEHGIGVLLCLAMDLSHSSSGVFPAREQNRIPVEQAGQYILVSVLNKNQIQVD